MVDVRELIGYVPWYFNMPDPDQGYEEAWRALIDSTNGFKGANGLATAEMTHPYINRVRYPESNGFESDGSSKRGCHWDGLLWPFAETQTLVALANLLNNYDQEIVEKGDYFYELKQYTSAQYQWDAGVSKLRPWIGQSACFRHKKDGVVTWVLKEPNYYIHQLSEEVSTGKESEAGPTIVPRQTSLPRRSENCQPVYGVRCSTV